ncbi:MULTISPECIES: M56 family metallopeptidase [Streptosporangium]|uniref:Zn-dependent protease with chaperone function n=1 Tax=Streptosporangium brasiliense TaxID=47480 RepID=A0ABT9RF03_9ACTN|nr:M56 family metallopeptidase [Streptosporangium brasiliense]MDP9867839.1 Zn-dependent protease with chaperone function [Streptosporangium brasiliense]
MTVWLIAAAVALVPLLLGGRAAERLAGAGWTHRCPRAALVMWQAIGLAGGLGAIGIGLVAAVAPLAAVFPHGAHTLFRQLVEGRGLDGLGPAHVAALVWSVGLIGWLALHTVRAALGTVRAQRRQRLLVDVVADPCVLRDAYVLPGERPVAYCIPGRRARIVLSAGAVELLGAEELEAVLGHERAHAAGRHDLLLLPFLALAQAFPWLPAAGTARQVVPVLLEMLADDRARRAHGELPLARALVRMAATATGPAPAGGLALADTAVVHRLERLISGPQRQPRWVPAAAYCAAGLLLSGPAAVLVAPVLCITIWRI